jgi:hypothetical protein
MSRTRSMLGVVALVVVAGAPRPAGAQAIPPEGPAVNPTIYKPSVGAKAIAVDCDDTKQTLAAAVADKTTADLNITFSGTCKEYLQIQRDGVAIRGKDATAAVMGGIDILSSRRILLEGFTCRDSQQQESCIGAQYGSSVFLHNIKVYNGLGRGVTFFNSVGLVEGLSIDKTTSTSMLVRGSSVRLEGELTFSNTVEACLMVDGVSSVFSKMGVITARDCAGGVVIQNNSTFQAPYATFNLNHNSFAGMMLSTQGTISFGGTITAKNNTQAGILVDDGSSFAPFTNIASGASLTLENNGKAGVYVRRGSYAEVTNVISNTGSTYGVFVDDSRLQLGRGKIANNKTADVRLQYRALAVFLEGAEVGTVSCDGTELVRGNKSPCVTDDSKPKTTSSKPQDK